MNHCFARRSAKSPAVLLFFFYLPAVLLPGFMFPISNMQEPAQWLTHLNPLRYFLAIIRDIFLKGSGWDILWPRFAALAGLGAALLLN